MAERPEFVIKHHGRGRDGRIFVSDGKLIVVAEVLRASPSGDELDASKIESILSRPQSRWTALADAEPSASIADAVRTKDGVALGRFYVELLSSSGLSIEVGTHGPTGAVLLRASGRIIGALMPLDVPAEAAPRPPRVGVVRGVIHGFTQERGFGRARLSDGRDVLVDASIVSGFRSGTFGDGVHVDLELRVGRDGALHAKLAWPASTDAPVAATPTPSPRVLVSRAEAFAELRANGLLSGVDERHFGELCETVLGETQLVDDEDVAQVLYAHYATEDSPTIAFSPADGVLLARDVHEDEERARAAVVELAARYQVTVGSFDAGDVDGIADGLRSAFEGAGRQERVVACGPPFEIGVVLVRERLVRGKLLMFGGTPHTPPLSPPPPRPPDETFVLTHFDSVARRAIAAAQTLADTRGHSHVEPLHVLATILRESGGSPVALEVAEGELERLPRRAADEKLAYVSAALLALLKDAAGAPGGPATVDQLRALLAQRRDASCALVLAVLARVGRRGSA